MVVPKSIKTQSIVAKEGLMTQKLFLIRVISHRQQDTQFWDPEWIPPEEGDPYQLPHEEIVASVHDAIEILENCTQYQPPKEEELNALIPGQRVTRVFHIDHGQGDWGAYPEGYLVKLLRTITVENADGRSVTVQDLSQREESVLRGFSYGLTAAKIAEGLGLKGGAAEVQRIVFGCYQKLHLLAAAIN
jgi:hypothetical protein